MTKDNVFAPIPVGDVEIYKASLDKVCDLEIETVLLAHNGMKTFDIAKKNKGHPRGCPSSKYLA